MNKKLVFSVVGRLMEFMALALMLPMAVSLIYREKVFIYFIITAVISFSSGLILCFLTRNHSSMMYAKEGFIIVTLAWVFASVIGAIPFFISGEIPNFADALFETVSGFTTTGASILTDVERLSHGMLFWRSFTHWIGGMGVLVFILAFISGISDRSIHILRAEMPGPIVGKLMPRAKDTSKILYIMYIVITLVQIALLLAGGMPLFDSVIHAFGTAGTGGFGIKADSIAGYSPYLQWVIGAFMLIFGINFNLYYLATIKRFRSILKSTELWVYIGIVAVSVLLITTNLYGTYGSFSDTLRNAFFQVSSIITTTGYATADFNLWPSFSKAVLILLMITGACAGSTAGGLKISRIVIIFRMIGREFRRMIHPRSVYAVRFEGKDVDEQVQRSVTTYFAIYIICIFAVFLMLSFEPFDFETNFTASIACFNNVGPGLAMVGPMGSYAGYSTISKLILSLAMLLGRLEIFPILIAMFPSSWTNRR
ncbi:MAG: TrkH family potassium uptake protein [Ruminococcaceae bacterium]|nr:TrkH family potassium uptake protein [Oscillospiraceae bacterium]